jgi:large subunit ribosomal protein L54
MLASGDTDAFAPKIPLQQQTIDLPSNKEGTVHGALNAVVKREEVRQAMRKERRAKIKETNYLKSM